MKMIDNKLTSFHMSDNPAAYEVQRGNHFIFTVSGFDAQMLLAGVYESAAEEGDYISEVADKIELSVDKASIPMISVEEIEIKRGNSKTYLAGTPSYEEGKFDVHDYIGLATLEALMAWQRLVYDVTTDTIGRAKDYKKQAELKEYTPDGELVRSWTLKGCWIKSLSEDDLDMGAGNEGKKISATFRYDRAIPKRSFEIMSGKAEI